MKKFALAAAAVAALALSVPSFTAPASAQGVTVRVGDGDRGHHRGWRHRDFAQGRDPSRPRPARRLASSRNTGMSKTVIKRSDGSRTVIKKFER